MNYWLKQALLTVIRQCERGDVLRTDDESTRAREKARAARVLLLHDNTPDHLIEKWLDDHEDIR